MVHKKKKYNFRWNTPVLKTFQDNKLEGQCARGTLATATASTCGEGTTVKYSYCSVGHVALGKDVACTATGGTATKQKYDCGNGLAAEDGAGCVNGVLPSNPANCNAGGAPVCNTGGAVGS